MTPDSGAPTSAPIGANACKAIGSEIFMDNVSIANRITVCTVAARFQFDVLDVVVV